MSSLVEALIEADKAVEDAQEGLKGLTEHARLLREETIPCAMQELGLEELKLATGQKLTVKQEVYASIPVDFRETAYAWLNNNGFGGLIKVIVKTEFQKGEQEQALELCNRLSAEGHSAAFEQGINPQTLKAFLREQLSSGQNIPLDIFGARPVWTAKISKK